MGGLVDWIAGNGNGVSSKRMCAIVSAPGRISKEELGVPRRLSASGPVDGAEKTPADFPGDQLYNKKM
jgi:hypothetical protein